MEKFLEEIKKEYFIWMKENLVYFPGCCYDATDILGSYLKANKLEVTRLCGYKNNFQNSTNFHMWLEYGNKVIDFTLFQFYINSKQKFKKVDSETTYNYCIEEIQRGDVVFSKDYYKKWFTEEKKYGFSFEDIAKKSSSFKDYLSKISIEIKKKR